MCATALCTLRCYDYYIQMLSRDTGRGGRTAYSQGVKQFWSVETLRWGGNFSTHYSTVFWRQFSSCVIFQVGDFADVEVDSLRRFLNDVFWISLRWIYPAWIFQTICTRLYSTTISSNHSILPSTCWNTLLQLPISRNFFSTKSTNIIINTNHNRIQQNSLLGPPLAVQQSYPKTKKNRCWPSVALIPFWVSVVQLYAFALPWYHTGPANWLKVGRGLVIDGDEWQNIGVFFKNKLLWPGRGSLNSRSHLIIFWGGVFDKSEWVLASCLESTWNPQWGTYSRQFSPLLSFYSRLRTLHTSHSITNHHNVSYAPKKTPTTPGLQNQSQHLSQKILNPLTRLCITEFCPQ